MIEGLLQKSIRLIPWRVRTAVKYMPGVRALQRHIMARFSSDRPFLHTVDAGPARGLVLELHLPRDKSLWTGTYEAGFAKAIANGVVKGDVCYDIGGFRGFMAGVLAIAGARQVFTFEPLPENIVQLQRLVSLNSSLPIKVWAIAIGNGDHEVEFQRMPEQSMGKVSESTFQREAGGGGRLVVPMRRIDTLVAAEEIPPPRLMKIDVEGAEILVLKGAENTLKQHKPMLFIEAHSHSLREQCTHFLQNLSYSVAQISPLSESRDYDVSHLRATPRI